MRVLLIANYFPPHYVGGTEVVVYNTCSGLLQRGVEAAVLMINARMPQVQDRYHQVRGVPVHEVTFRPYLLNNPYLQAFDPRVYRETMAEIRRFQPDLVHMNNMSGATLAPFVAARRLNMPVVLSLHDLWLLCPNNMLYRQDGTSCDPAIQPTTCGRCFRRYDFWANIPRRRQIFSHLVQNTRLFISPSRKLIELHVAAGYDRTRFRLVPHGIRPTAAQDPSNARVQEIAQDRGLYHNVLFSGTLAEIKGIQTLIAAVPLLSRYVDRFRLIVAGWGTEEHFFRALRRFGPETVTLLGRVPFWEMRALYAAADLTVMPSTCHDNSPMAIHESLMAGTPAAGSDIGGIPELIQEGKTGYLFPPGNEVALAEQVIRHFAQSAQERRAQRRLCAEHARDHMTLDHYLDGLEQVYREALGT
jgi:glycosyltransferase involved in cell wall biosynthesis